jgi:CsoR family transcriptional regulator, copper-sensing transcriptional repressor
MKRTPGYNASQAQLNQRLARIEGQIRGISAMVGEGRYCIDVLTQIQAAQAALNAVALGLVDDHVRHCMTEGKSKKRSQAEVDELMGAVARLVKS